MAKNYNEKKKNNKNERRKKYLMKIGTLIVINYQVERMSPVKTIVDVKIWQKKGKKGNENFLHLKS